MISFILSSAIIKFISTALSFWMLICMWIMFKKAGRKGWESIIPVWNVYVLFKIAGKKGWFWVLFLVPILWIVVSLIFFFIMKPGDINEYSSIYTIRNMINRILGLLTLILPLMAWITLPYGLTKKFGKSNWFYLGMLFLTPIFFGILAFNNNIKYEGVEFDKKYSLKKWLLITLGISLVIGCCDAGLKYYQYKDFYSYFDNFNYDYEIKDENSGNEKNSKNKTNESKDIGIISKDECYSEDGKLNNNPDKDSKGNIVNCYNSEGKENGKWLGYNGNGIPIVEENYTDGIKNGKEIRTRYDTGKLRYEVNYINGLREGEGKSYYQDGELEFIENYENGVLEGKKEYYFKSGKVKREEILEFGKIVSASNYFEDNDIEEIEVYINGERKGFSYNYPQS